MKHFRYAAAGLFGAVSLASLSGQAHAALYDCSIRGTNIQLELMVNGAQGVATLGDRSGHHPMRKMPSGLYAGERSDGVSVQFDARSNVLWLGPEQLPCTVVLADGGQNHDSGAVGGQEITGINRQGRSLGGNLRDGPGTNFSKLRGLAEGTPLTILTDTGVMQDGYRWFEVALDDGQRGYQWGGILCSNGDVLDGLFQSCGAVE